MRMFFTENKLFTSAYNKTNQVTEPGDDQKDGQITSNTLSKHRHKAVEATSEAWNKSSRCRPYAWRQMWTRSMNVHWGMTVHDDPGKPLRCYLEPVRSQFIYTAKRQTVTWSLWEVFSVRMMTPGVLYLGKIMDTMTLPLRSTDRKSSSEYCLLTPSPSAET